MSNQNDVLSAELKALLDATPELTDATHEQLSKAGNELANDWTFKFEVAKAIIINAWLEVMHELNLSKSALARRLGCSRQYLQSLLDEESTTNFTLETIYKVCDALGLDLESPRFKRCQPQNVIRCIQKPLSTEFEFGLIERRQPANILHGHFDRKNYWKGAYSDEVALPA